MSGDSVLDEAVNVGARVDDFAYAGRLGYPLKIQPRIGTNGLENPKDYFADLFGSRPVSRRGTKSTDMFSSDQFSDQDVSVPKFDLGWETTPVRPALRTSRPKSSNVPHPKVSTPTRDITGMNSTAVFKEMGGGALIPPSPIGGGEGDSRADSREHTTIRDSIQVSRVRNSTASPHEPQQIPSFRIFASSDSGAEAAGHERTTHPPSSQSGSEDSLGVYRGSKRKTRASSEFNHEDFEDAPIDDFENDFDNDDDFNGPNDSFQEPLFMDDYGSDHDPDEDLRGARYSESDGSNESDVVITSRISYPYDNADRQASGESDLEASDYNSDASVMEMVSENEVLHDEEHSFEPTLTTDDSDVYEEWDTGNMEDETTFVVPEISSVSPIDSSGLRRSKRHRIEPVRYWLGEKPVYRLSTRTYLPTLKEVVRVSSDTASAKRERKPRKQQRLDDLADKSAVVAQVFDAEKMTFEFREVAKKLDWKNMEPAKGNPKVKVQVLFPQFDGLPISIEGLCFERGAKIPEQNTGSYAYVVSVLTGQFQFQLHQENIELRRGASLGVQRGNDFGVQNIGPGQGTLFMIKIHAEMFDRGVVNEESISNFSHHITRSMSQYPSEASLPAKSVLAELGTDGV